MYTIDVVPEMMKVYPESVRVWEQHRIILPAMGTVQWLYSENDLKRLEFIKEVISK